MNEGEGRKERRKNKREEGREGEMQSEKKEEMKNEWNRVGAHKYLRKSVSEERGSGNGLQCFRLLMRISQ